MPELEPTEPETWRPVVGWEGVYDVSSLGRVRRVKSYNNRRCGVINPQPNHFGYPQSSLADGSRRRTVRIHCLVAAAFLGPKPSGMEINHKNGIKTDNRTRNLEYVTHSENGLHAFRVLLRPPVSNKGQAAGRAKLTDDQVRQIRSRYAAGGVTQQVLADQFGVNQTMIGFIVRRANWTHLDQ